MLNIMGMPCVVVWMKMAPRAHISEPRRTLVSFLFLPHSCRFRCKPSVTAPVPCLSPRRHANGLKLQALNKLSCKLRWSWCLTITIEK